MAVLQIIRRSQKPIRYHAGALFQINFQTFITVCIFLFVFRILVDFEIKQ